PRPRPGPARACPRGAPRPWRRTAVRRCRQRPGTPPRRRAACRWWPAATARGRCPTGRPGGAAPGRRRSPAPSTARAGTRAPSLPGPPLGARQRRLRLLVLVAARGAGHLAVLVAGGDHHGRDVVVRPAVPDGPLEQARGRLVRVRRGGDRKSTRLNSSHVKISYAVFCLKKKRTKHI